MQQKDEGAAGDRGGHWLKGPVAAALAVMIVTHVPVVMSSLTLPAMAPLAAETLGLPARYVGLYTSVVYGVAVATSFLAPGLVVRFGPVRTSQGTLVFAAAGLLALAVGNVAAALLSAVVVGIAYAPGTPASSRLLSGLTTEGRRSGVFSIKQTSVPAGGAAAGLLAPPLALVFGWQGAAVALALLCLAIALAVQPWRESFDRDRVRGGRIVRVNPLGPVLMVWRSPRLRALGLMAMAYAGAQFTFASVLVTFLVEQAGMRTVEAGAILSAALVTSVAARILWGYAAHRIAPNLVLAGLGVLAAGAFAVALAATPEWPRAALLGLGCWFGAVGFSWNGIFLANAADAAEGKVAEATTGVMSYAFTGALATPVLFTWLAAKWDYGAGLIALIVLVLVAAAYVTVALRPAIRHGGANGERLP